MKFIVTHETRYQYQNPVSQCYSRSHIIPRETFNQHPSNSQITVSPTPTSAHKRIDYFGNRSYHFAINSQHTALSIKVTTQINIDPDQRDHNNYPLTYGEAINRLKTDLSIENLYAREFLLNSPMIKVNDDLLNFAKPFFQLDKSLLASVSELNQAIHESFKYESGATQVATPISEVMEQRKGVCQDFAHIAIGCLRSLGIPCRYVSGYIETEPPPGKERLIGADATHAWFSVFIPGAGWFDFDPTNNSTPRGQHIVTAWGRDYSDVSPLRGIIFGGSGKQKLSVSVDVARIE